MQIIERGCEHTDPENRGICHFCHKQEDGYAMRDINGKFQPACHVCIRRDCIDMPETKRKQVGITFIEDLDTDEALAKKARAEKKAKAKHGAPAEFITSAPIETETAEAIPIIASSVAKNVLITEPKKSTLRAWMWKKN